MTCSSFLTTIFIATFTLLTAFCQVCFSIQNVRLILPPFVHADTTATLLCLYDLEGDSLYSVQWYRGRFEFFRFVPKEKPQRKAFRVPGLSVDVLASNAHQVTLRNIPVQISGEFSCEITTDTPRFRTSRASNNLTVVGLDLDVRVPKRNFHYGDVVEANCTLTPFLPMTKLKFYWNVTPIPDHFIKDKQADFITLTLNSSNFLVGKTTPISVRLTCSAVLDNTYYIISKSVSFELEPSDRFGSVSWAGRPTNKTSTQILIFTFVIAKVMTDYLS